MYAILSAKEMNKHVCLSLFHSIFHVSKSHKDFWRAVLPTGEKVDESD